MDEKDKELQEMRRKIAEMAEENKACNKVINDLLNIMRSEVFAITSIVEKTTEELKKAYEKYTGSL